MTEEDMKRFKEDQHWSSWLLLAVGLYVMLVCAINGMVTVIGWVLC